MKILIYFVVGSLLSVLMIQGFLSGLELEAKRQCIVAKDNCEKYADAGACDPKYMKVCDGVEDDE